MKKTTAREINEFLRESNYIEDERSRTAFDDAKKAWEYLMRQKVMSFQVVLRTHALLMRSRKLPKKYVGNIRDIAVYVGRKEMTAPNIIYSELDFWIQCMNGCSAYDAEDTYKTLHVFYEKIHPFVDGNGRTGRMFMNWMRLKKMQQPLLIIHEGKEQLDYYKWFRQNGSS